MSIPTKDSGKKGQEAEAQSQSQTAERGQTSKSVTLSQPVPPVTEPTRINCRDPESLDHESRDRSPVTY